MGHGQEPSAPSVASPVTEHNNNKNSSTISSTICRSLSQSANQSCLSRETSVEEAPAVTSTTAKAQNASKFSSKTKTEDCYGMKS